MCPTGFLDEKQFKVNDKVVYPYEGRMLEWKINAINNGIATIKGTEYRIITDVTLIDLRTFNPLSNQPLNEPHVKTKRH